MIKIIIDLVNIWFDGERKHPFILKNEGYDGFVSIYKLIKNSALSIYPEHLCIMTFKVVIAANLHFLEFSLDRNRVRKLIN